MKRILVTGATGNIGSEVIHYLSELNTESQYIAAVRNVDKARKRFTGYSNLTYRQFDFEKPETYEDAFRGMDILFLLRPPHISKVDKIFRPLLISARENGIRNVVFLSVQGAEKSKVIPHNKIERLIIELGFNYIFVRPGYFMQNLITALKKEIVNHRYITLPAGNAKFNWIDTRDVGETVALLIQNFDEYQDQAFDITGEENLSFPQVAKILSDALGVTITYHSINPIRFFFKKRSEGMSSAFAIVMTVLHFLPRFQREPELSSNVRDITGHRPTTLVQFVDREKRHFQT